MDVLVLVTVSSYRCFLKKTFIYIIDLILPGVLSWPRRQVKNKNEKKRLSGFVLICERQ